MKIVERKEDDLLNARTVVGVWKHTDLLRTYVEGEERGQYSEALTARKDNVVYSDDETYEQQQVPALMPNPKEKQLVGNSSLEIHAYLYADMPVSTPKGSTGIGMKQYSEALTARKDNVVYSDDETYEQNKVPALMPNSKKKQLVGNSSLEIHAYLYADMPVSTPKGTTTDEPNGCRFLLKL